MMARPRSSILALVLCGLLGSAQAQQDMPNAPAPQQSSAAPAPAPQQQSIHTPSNLAIPHSDNPLKAYAPSLVPKPDLANSPRLQQLMRDGKL